MRNQELSNTINIRLESVQYGSYCLWMGLDAQRNLYMTYPAIEAILNYEENLARKKIGSKKLKDLYQEQLKVGKNQFVLSTSLQTFQFPRMGKLLQSPTKGSFNSSTLKLSSKTQ
jgi:hypothetical protein